MRKAYKFELMVLPENLEKVKKILKGNVDLFVRANWNKTEVMIEDK